MVNIEKVIPDLLNRKEALALGGVPRPYSNKEESERIVAQTLSVDGVYISPGEAPVAYGDKARQEVLKSLEGIPQSWVYFYGGWNNGMTLEANIMAFLFGNVPLNQRKVKDLRIGLMDPDRARIYFDYRSDFDSFSGWKDMLRQKGIQVSQEEYEEMTIAHLLLEIGGAPTRWTTMVTLPEKDEPLLPPTTSAPFPGAQYGHGFFVAYLNPVFSEGPFQKPIFNNTGARATDTIGIANLLVRLRHNAQVAKEVYVEDAQRRAEQIGKKGQKPPFTRDEVERYAGVFVETQEPVVEDIQRILSKWKDEEIKGFQYAINLTSDRMLSTAIYKVPRIRPYAWIKTIKGWEVAV